MSINACSHCGSAAVIVEIPFDHEFNFGPGGFSEFCVQCSGCGSSGPRLSMVDVPLPKVKRRYMAYLGSFAVPVEDYEFQDIDMEIAALATEAWNKVHSGRR